MIISGQASKSRNLTLEASGQKRNQFSKEGNKEIVVSGQASRISESDSRVVGARIECLYVFELMKAERNDVCATALRLII